MTDAISAYNERLEAMAAACEAAERSHRQTAHEYGGWPEARNGFLRSADHLHAAAAFIRSQMLRPIGDAPKDGRVLTLSERQRPKVDFRPFDGWPTHFLPLPQIGDSHDMGRG